MFRWRLGKVILGLLLALGVILTNVLSLPIIYSAVIAGLVFFIPTFYDELVAQIRDWRSRQEKSEQIARLYRKFENRVDDLSIEPFANLDTNVSTEVVSENIEIVIHSLYPRFASGVFGHLETMKRETFLIFIFCREIEVTSDSIQIAKFKSKIGALLSSYDFVSPGSREVRLLSVYKKLRPAITSAENVNVSNLFQDEDSVEEYRSVVIEFLQKYGRTEDIGMVLLNELQQAREFKNTLAELVARGKINTKTINRQAVRQINDRLEERGIATTKFIVFSRRFQYNDQLEESIEKFPHIKMGRKYPSEGFPEEFGTMRMYIVYPEERFISASEFYESEIEPYLSEDILLEYDDAFAAVMPLEITDFKMYPSRGEASETELVSGSLDSLEYLITGSSEDLNTVITEVLMNEIEISDILSIIPFNVFVPELSRREKEIIINNYDHLKSKFGINSLFDWADIDAAELATELSEVDRDNINTFEDWSSIANDITEQAMSHTEAVFD